MSIDIILLAVISLITYYFPLKEQVVVIIIGILCFYLGIKYGVRNYYQFDELLDDEKEVQQNETS